MSHAAAALRALDALAATFRQPASLPPLSRCAQQAEPRHEDALPTVADDMLEAIRLDLRLLCESGGLAMRPRKLRLAPLVLWHGQPQAAGVPGLIDAFLGVAARRPRWLRDLIEAWLRDFGPDRIAHAQTGARIGALLPRSQDPRLRPWQDADRRYRLFDAEAAPGLVAHALLHGPEPANQVLDDLGLNDRLRAAGGFFRAVMTALIGELPASLRSRAARIAWDRARPLLEADSTHGTDGAPAGLRIPELVGETARASLAPWLVEPQWDDAPREDIKHFLLRALGDPRIHQQRWEAAGEPATRLLCGWLASESLEAFLSLISESNDDPQWRYRQAFWRACLRKMPSAEVWVILGSDLTARATAISSLQGSFGRLADGAGVTDQAVLLMRLGNLVLSEWSNVGPVRAWDSADPHCPALYKLSAYSARELRRSSLDFPDHPVRGNGGAFGGKGLWHRNGQMGLWQGCAAALLAQRLGLRLSWGDYMPNGR